MIYRRIKLDATDGRTDGHMDGHTDITALRVATTFVGATKNDIDTNITNL